MSSARCRAGASSTGPPDHGADPADLRALRRGDRRLRAALCRRYPRRALGDLRAVEPPAPCRGEGAAASRWSASFPRRPRPAPDGRPEELHRAQRRSAQETVVGTAIGWLDDLPRRPPARPPAAGDGRTLRARPPPATVQATGGKGGDLRLLAKPRAGTLDPQVNYTLQYWQLYQSLYDGLVAFKKAGGAGGLHRRARPGRGDARAAGRRQDLRLQAAQGHQVLQRPGRDRRTTSSPPSSASSRSRSPTAGSFYNGIVGADACLKTPATCTARGRRRRPTRRRARSPSI